MRGCLRNERRDGGLFEDGPLNITAYLDAMDPGNVPNLDSNGDGSQSSIANNVTTVPAAMAPASGDGAFVFRFVVDLSSSSGASRSARPVRRS